PACEPVLALGAGGGPGPRLLVLVCLLFQAEDGIRDPLVTGVQTCALPISAGRRRNAVGPLARKFLMDFAARNRSDILGMTPETRSEERRVGKERSTRSAQDE